MKIYSINKFDSNEKIVFKGANNTTKLGIGALIIASSLFMLSNAADSFVSENSTKTSINMKVPASIFWNYGNFYVINRIKKR